MRPGRAWLLLAALLGAPAAAAADPSLALPVDCTLGKSCFIQNYVDTEMSGSAKDFSCGSLTYDGHKGTDFRLKSYVAMDVGVAVLAAAPGTVLRTRDGMADVSIRETGLDAVKNREAGNSVVIDHGDGWITQYSHLKLGSVAVKPGQPVSAGTRLGEIGLSGETEFPHLHFEVRHDDQPVDPFTGAPKEAGCGLAGHPLWKGALPYIPTGLLGDGFALDRPEADAARHGAYATTALTILSPSLVYWIDVFGLQQGDRLRLTLTGPDGALMAQSETPIARSKAQFFAFAGANHPARGWKSGFYIGKLEVLRGDQVVVMQRNQIALP
jgi:hypothetical protein